MKQFSLVVLISLQMLCAAAGQAEQSKRFGRYEIHYSVVNTTFLSPEIAAHYRIARGKQRAFINLAVREHLGDGSTAARAASLEGRTWDLFQNQFLEFQEIREGEAIYYIGEFSFSDKELRFYNIQVLPDGAERSYQLKFQHKTHVEN